MIKQGYEYITIPEGELNKWAWQSAAINVSIAALAIVVSVALLTLIFVYIPEGHRWTTMGLVMILGLIILLLMGAHGRVSIELKALESLHKDVLGALTPDTAKVLLLKWTKEQEQGFAKESKPTRARTPRTNDRRRRQ